MSSSQHDDAHDEHNEGEHDLGDARMDDRDVENQRFVNMHDFVPPSFSCHRPSCAQQPWVCHRKRGALSNSAGHGPSKKGTATEDSKAIPSAAPLDLIMKIKISTSGE